MPKKAEITMTIRQARDLEKTGVQLKVATVHQTMGPNWREIIWLHSPEAPNLGKRCYVCDTHSVKDLQLLMQYLPTMVDVWHVRVTGIANDFYFNSGMDVIISGQKTWHHVPGVYKDCMDEKIEFRDRNRDLLLRGTRVKGEVLKDAIIFKP